ncbi:hypothetical protein LINPERHAP2_LOCUS33897, partial [Linum perenne]
MELALSVATPQNYSNSSTNPHPSSPPTITTSDFAWAYRESPAPLLHRSSPTAVEESTFRLLQIPSLPPARPPSIFPYFEKTHYSSDEGAVAGAPPFFLARRRPSSNAARRETSQNRRLSAEGGDDGASLSL